MRARGWLLAGLYVGAVAALAASAFWRPDEAFTWDREGVAMLLTLPALLPALPAVYVLGAVLWHVTDAADGGPMWPVTLGFALMFAGVAAADVWLVRRVLRASRLRRLGRRAGRKPGGTATVPRR
jgi:hypothetical protein